MDPTARRRRFVQATGSALTIGLAGCLTGGDEDGSDGSDDGDDGSDGGDGSGGNESDGGSDGDDGTDGDDGEASPGSDGLLYAFSPDSIALIDPEEGAVVDEITDGIDGYSYGDAVRTADGSQLFVVEDSLEQVLVIDLETREIVEEVGMGPGGTHMYHPKETEMWAHADDEGAFYVIDTENYDVTVVQSGLENEGHGKLLYHADFGSTGYATNVNDAAALVIDMDAYERTDHIELGDEGGTHSKAYSTQNGLAYFERSGGVGKTAVVDPETNEVVEQLDVGGTLFHPDSDEVLGIIDHGTVHFFDGTSEETAELGTVEIDGGPDHLAFYEGDDGLYAYTANTMNSNSAIIDVDAMEVVGTVDIGDIERPEGAQHLHRGGVTGGGYFFSGASADGTVAVVDMAAQETVANVEVAEGVDTVQYIPRE
ncbi:hypothetical protein [Halovivax limisalsi]|uniref:hypothetical protein n=1 Tax=Halovivax limisalsi TaxID=1453760 RepID=UPI001FFC7415|nr:hypothetical protein [Halovivax limisalsi]